MDRCISLSLCTVLYIIMHIHVYCCLPIFGPNCEPPCRQNDPCDYPTQLHLATTMAAANPATKKARKVHRYSCMESLSVYCIYDDFLTTLYCIHIYIYIRKYVHIYIYIYTGSIYIYGLLLVILGKMWVLSEG